MTIKDDILAAFGKLDAKDDALWNRDGTPKLEAIRNAANDQRISREEMMGSLAGKRRPEVSQDAAPQAGEQAPQEQAAQAGEQAPQEPDPDAGKTDEVYAVKPNPDGVIDTETPDKGAIIEEAKEAIAVLDAQAQDAAARKEIVDGEINELARQREKWERVIETHSEELSQAAAIKRVQAQTVANLNANRKKAEAVAQAVAGAGIVVASPASALDAALQGRKRTPEQANNAAEYMRQQQQRRLAERLGTV